MTTPAGRGGLVLYLDFDGVLHHENCLWHPKRGAYLVAPERYTLFQHTELLVQVLTPYPEVQIVLSTSWIRRYGVATSAKRLPAALQSRVIGGTFHSRYMRDEDFGGLLRGQQVHEDVLRRRPRDWIALDDDAEGWPAEHAHRHIHTHMYEGISAPEVLEQLKAALQLLSKKEQKTVESTVVAVLPSYRQVRVKTADGYQYAITETTPGVDWSRLHEGQRLKCTVTTSSLPQVLKVLSNKKQK